MWSLFGVFAPLLIFSLSQPSSWPTSGPTSAPASLPALPSSLPISSPNTGDEETPIYVEEMEVSASEPARAPVGGKRSVVTPDATWGASASAADLLRDIPEIKLRAAGGDGQRQIALLRGASEEQVLILLDGVRLNEGGGGGVDLASIPAAAISQIEVITGAAAALYGPEALGGVILITTRAADAAPETGLSASLGSFDTVRASVARVSKSGAWGLLSVFSGISSEGNFSFQNSNGQERTRENNDARVGSLLLKADRALGGPWSLGILASLDVTGRGVPGPEQFASDSATQKDRRALLAAKLTGDDVEEGLDYTLLASLRASSFAFADPSPTLGPPVDTSAREISPGLWGRMRLTRGSHRFGAEISLWREFFFSTDLVEGKAARGRGALAFSDEITLGRLTLAPALRLEGTSTIGLAPLPRLGLSFDGGGGFGVQVAAGRAYRPPSFRDLFVRLDGVAGNPDLLPEDAWEVSGGLSFTRPGLKVSAVAFTRSLENMILFSPVSALFIRADNFSGYFARGAELAFHSHISRFSIEAGYTLLLTSNGAEDFPLELPGFPRRRLFFRTSWEGEVFRLFFRGDLQSEFFLNRHDTQIAPARSFLDAGGALRFWKESWAALEVRNILNDRDAVDSLQAPLPPRSFTVTLSTRF